MIDDDLDHDPNGRKNLVHVERVGSYLPRGLRGAPTGLQDRPKQLVSEPDQEQKIAAVLLFKVLRFSSPCSPLSQLPRQEYLVPRDNLMHGTLPREPEELAEVAPHPDVDHVLGVEVGGDEEPLVKDARAYDIELPGQVVEVVRVVLEV